MGSLTPGAEYVYERQDGVVYAREKGKPADARIVVGWDWEPETNPARVRGTNREQMLENQLWYKIRQEALANDALHESLERVKMLYYLSIKDGQK